MREHDRRQIATTVSVGFMPGVRLACPIEDVEHLPDVLAHHRIGKRRCEPVEIDGRKVVRCRVCASSRRLSTRSDTKIATAAMKIVTTSGILIDERQPKRAHPAAPSNDRDFRRNAVEQARVLDAEAVEPEHPQDGSPVLVFAHSDEGFLEPLYARVARKACRAGDRRETQEFGLAHDARSADELGLGLAHDLVDVTIDAAARRQARTPLP